MVAGTLNFVTVRKAITLMFALCQVTQGSTFRGVCGEVAGMETVSPGSLQKPGLPRPP